MKGKKYKELTKLKGLLREKKITYEKLAKEIGMSLSAFSNKINGITIFDLVDVANIAEIVGIKKEDIYLYFF